LFRSFFIAGFESATGLNQRLQWIDQISATEHDRRIDRDYAMISKIGIHVARDGVRWPLVDTGRKYNFSSLDLLLSASEKHGVEPIYDLFHYGYPRDLDIFSSGFIERFSSYCHAVAERIKFFTDPPHYFTPVNEPSYFAWAAGDAGRFAPHTFGRSFELKIQLARAAIAGIDAIRSVLPRARMVNADPLCRVAIPRNRPDLSEEVRHFNENVVFESWDMLSGRLFPELGGSPSHLDVVGINYYWTNQWEHSAPEIPLAPEDERKWPLQDLIRWVWHRYRQPMVLTETAHVGKNRGPWIRQATFEVEEILNEGIPLKGLCLYPILGMPEWHDQSSWARMGLWDLVQTQRGLARVPHRSSHRALRDAQHRLEGLGFDPTGIPRTLASDRRLL